MAFVSCRQKVEAIFESGLSSGDNYMKQLKIIAGLLLLLALGGKTLAQDTTYIKVHFLYGSKPKRAFKDVETKWFGGQHGGHVGIEMDSSGIIDFVPEGEFHYVARKDNFHSKFAFKNADTFYGIFGASSENVKKMTITIPISSLQKQKLDSISNLYIHQTPYDYAFIGMRCSAAAYDLLSQIGIVKRHGYHRTYLKIFYPKKLRKRLIKKAKQHHWTTTLEDGTHRRKWEND